MGVMSRMSETLRPAAAMARSADSRPAPGPFTITETFFRPCSIALAAASPAATWAANGVDLRDPLNPRAPADDQESTFPETSVMVMMVLLNVLWMKTMPVCTFLRVFFLPLRSAAAGAAAAPPAAGAVGGADGFCSSAMSDCPYLPAGGSALTMRRTMPRFGPLRVRALVWVRWPRTGRPLRWRRPR